MKIYKEYPATHSMSTSWYIVDDEGNVGILDYNENGPVPWGVEETCGDAMKYGHWEDCEEHNLLKFNLTKDQILDLHHDPHKPSEEESWYECVVRIDKSKTERFLELCKNKDIDNSSFLCVSEELGLYEIDAFDCAHDNCYKEDAIHGTLKTMLDENIILEVYSVQTLDMSDKYKDGEVVHDKEFDNAPYFVYHQPYWPDNLPQKMHEPKHPVTIDQIPQSFRHRLHKIPGHFKDMETFQIAQYYPCHTYSNEDPIYYINGCAYETSPLPDGSKVYTKVSLFEFPCFAFCSEKEKFKCTKSSPCSCCSIEDMLLTDNPTVLIIFDPKDGYDYLWKVKTDIVFQKAYATSYIPKFPYAPRKNYWYSKHEVEKFMNKDYLLKVFKGSKGYIEAVVNDMKPRVILVTDKVYRTIVEVYPVGANVIEINGAEYPLYKLTSLEENRETIEALACMPYQGNDHPLVISIEDMKELVRTGIAE